ncbi:MAG: ribonuclease HII [Clostridia bacterium]|nr:ribonuclease HII [Clostridia bacterium]
MSVINMFEYETAAKNEGYKIVCGVDEAGRGPLAGPVFAAAVVLDENNLIEGINDSKKLSEKKRELLFDEIKNKATAFSIAMSSEKEIDNYNILQATMLAMKRAVDGLFNKPDFVLIDGNKAPDLNIPTKTVVKGDSLSLSIAAASILAKVSRDRYMKDMAKIYPQYAFEKHKGYGTKLHRELILQYGPCRIHRESFLKNILKK